MEIFSRGRGLRFWVDGEGFAGEGVGGLGVGLVVLGTRGDGGLGLGLGGWLLEVYRFTF